MSPTLLEAVIAVLLVWIAWQIGTLVAPVLLRRLRAKRKTGEGGKEKKPPTIDI